MSTPLSTPTSNPTGNPTGNSTGNTTGTQVADPTPVAAPELWQVHPGWGIRVDLTPPEIRQARQVRGLRRGIGAALVVVLLLCVAAGLDAARRKGAAQDDYDAERDRTTALQTEALSYSDVTAMQEAIAGIDEQVSLVMADDVDVVNLMARIRYSLPPDVTISDESIALLGGAAALAQAGTDVPAPGGLVIGSVTLIGNARTIDDVAALVTVLSRLVGVSGVVPTSTTSGEDGVGYTVSMNLTDAVLSHRFDPEEAP